MNQLEIIESRINKLISLNRTYNYTKSFSPVHKTEQYFRLLINLKRQRIEIYNERRKNSNYSKNLSKAVKNISNVLSVPVQPLTITPIR